MKQRRFLIILLVFVGFKAYGSQQEYWPQEFCPEVLDYTYYSVCYDPEHRQARWVKHALTLESIKSKQKRTNDYRKDPQIDDPVLSSDYRYSGFDRGHLVPAADMKLNHTAMSETFYMTNMSPQRPGFNRRIWASIEWDMRGFVFDYGTAHVVTAPILHVGLERIDSGVSVPETYYKIAYFPQEERMVAYLIDNRFVEDGEPEDFLVTVDEVEAATGMDFFSELPDVLENHLESHL